MGSIQIKKSMIAIGNPINDISGELDKDQITKYNLLWGKTSFANEGNIGIFDCLENSAGVSYVPGGSVQNSLRVANWCFNSNPTAKGNYKLTMIGCVGNDSYKEKIVNALDEIGVNHLFQTNEEYATSRCAVGIYLKERCLVPQIIASNKLTMEFVKSHMSTIMEHEILLIEGYFIIEKYDIVKELVEQFKAANKPIIFTLCSTFLLDASNGFRDKIMEIANYADMIFGNMEEAEALTELANEPFQETILKCHQLLEKKERYLIITAGSRGVLASKFNYNDNKLDFIIQSFPSFIDESEFVDFNGAGDAFLGGFISQFMQGKTLEQCCKAGNTAAGVIIRNVGCTFPKEPIDFDRC